MLVACVAAVRVAAPVAVRVGVVCFLYVAFVVAVDIAGAGAFAGGVAAVVGVVCADVVVAVCLCCS